MYEIEEFSDFRKEYFFHSLFKTITGLPYEDIDPVLKQYLSKSGTLTGQRIIKVCRELGFNTNTRFIRFDKKTTYPAFLRLQIFNKSGSWAIAVYYNDRVYLPYCGGAYDSLHQFLEENRTLKPTSMLQVWI